jgi:hypothetical protein
MKRIITFRLVLNGTVEVDDDDLQEGGSEQERDEEAKDMAREEIFRAGSPVIEKAFQNDADLEITGCNKAEGKASNEPKW